MSLKPKKPKQKLTKKDLKKQHEERTEHAQHMDETFKAKLAPTNEVWAKQPGRYDSRGIDYPEKKGKTKKKGRPKQSEILKEYKKRIREAESVTQFHDIIAMAHIEDISEKALLQIENWVNKAQTKNITKSKIKREENQLQTEKKIDEYKEQLRKSPTDAHTIEIIGEASRDPIIKKSNYARANLKVFGEVVDYNRRQVSKRKPEPKPASLKVLNTRAADTGIETMKAVIKDFKLDNVSKTTEIEIDGAENLGELNDVWMKLDKEKAMWGVGTRERKSLLENKGVVLDSSKAMAVSPKHYSGFQIPDNAQEVKLYYDTFPKLPDFVDSGTSVFVVNEKGKRIATYSSNHLDILLKATKDFDMKWFLTKDKPIFGVNQKTGEKVILAPRVEKVQTKEQTAEQEKEYEKDHLNLSHKSEVFPEHKLAYTRKTAIITMPDGRALKITTNSASSMDNLDKAREKAVWSVPLLKDLTDREMYRYAFNVVFNDDGRSWGGTKGVVSYLKTARTDPSGTEDWKISNQKKDVEIVTDNFVHIGKGPIKFTEAKGYGRKGERWLNASHKGRTLHVKKSQIDKTKALFGKDTKFYWNEPDKTFKQDNVIIADAFLSKAQIRISTRSIKK